MGMQHDMSKFGQKIWDFPVYTFMCICELPACASWLTDAGAWFGLIIGMHGIPSISLHNQSGLDENTLPPSSLQLPSFLVEPTFAESLLSQHLQGSQRNGEDSSKALIFNLEENKCLSCLIIHGIPWCGLMMPWVSRRSRLSGAGHLCIWVLLMAKCFLPLSCVSFRWPKRENNAEDVLVCALTYQGQSLVLFPLQVAHWSQVSSCLYHTGWLIERGFLSTEALTTHVWNGTLAEK